MMMMMMMMMMLRVVDVLNGSGGGGGGSAQVVMVMLIQTEGEIIKLGCTDTDCRSCLVIEVVGDGVGGGRGRSEDGKGYD